MWCNPHVDSEYVVRMEDVLDLYAEAPDPARPLVCFDETPVQLIGEVRQSVPAAHCMRELVDVQYPDGTCIRVVQDNLSIHKLRTLDEAFAPVKARRILRRLPVL
jgi:hypothetical protein